MNGKHRPWARLALIATVLTAWATAGTGCISVHDRGPHYWHHHGW